MRTSLVGDRRGQIALVFAIAGMTIVSGVGAGIDLMRAYGAEQRLSEAAALTCQYASRPSVYSVVENTASGAEGGGSAGVTAYVSSVTTYLNTALQSQNLSYTQTTANPFTYVANGAGNVALTASIPTVFMQIIGVSSIGLSANIQCFTSLASVTPPVANGSAPVIQETFQTNTSCNYNSYCWTKPNGTSAAPGTAIPLVQTFPSSPSYTGAEGLKWYVTGYCVEVDAAGAILSNVPGGGSTELNCDNGFGTAGNSAISTEVYLAAGNYELRWWYASRVDYLDYEPAYICGSAASDTSWANDTNSSGGPVSGAWRNNQINVYLDRNTTGAPPMHTTLDGSEQLAGSAMIDTCVYATNWVQRSVRIKVTAPDNYWLTFAADGQNDSYGGQTADLQICQGTCAGTVQDNFPSTWLAANNGGADVSLFQDTFSEVSATRSGGFGGRGGSSGSMATLDNATGTSGTSASGWPSAVATGWATAPVDQVGLGTSGGPLSLSNSIVAAGSTASSGSTSRLFSRAFLLEPGYYNLTYYYRSNIVFNTAPSLSCGATPSAAGLRTASGSAAATIRNTTTSGTYALNANTVGVFIASGQLISTPNDGTSYTNPDSTLSDTPPVAGSTFVAPDTISLTNYSPSSTSALLDICGYSSTWTARSINFEIQKTGEYWLTFSSEMANTGNSGSGGTIADVQLTALGSPAMTSPPSNPVVVPAAGVQPGGTISANGYFIVADPLVFPAPQQ
jgi:hypothetical protein